MQILFNNYNETGSQAFFNNTGEGVQGIQAVVRYIIWPRLCRHLTITTICGRFPNSFHSQEPKGLNCKYNLNQYNISPLLIVTNHYHLALVKVIQILTLASKTYIWRTFHLLPNIAHHMTCATVMRYLMSFVSPVSGFNVMADRCIRTTA